MGETDNMAILQRDGLTIDMLGRLSYQSEMGINLKKNLHYFDKDSIMEELIKVNEWYDTFDDMLGFRSLCDNYEDVLELRQFPELRVADMSKGKASDDGYRGVHVYFQLDGVHYPIEIQYNTYYDRQINNWLHKYIYKKGYDNSVGCRLRGFYEGAKIRSESDFKEALEHVLSDS
jgi:putative GTP pyrophosphokinase